MPPPLSFATERLLVRAPLTEDAPALVEALRESYEDLWPWLPWARELPDLEEAAARLGAARERYLADQDYWLMLLRRRDGLLLGGSGLHPRGEEGRRLEIGYWIRSSCAGRGYVGEAVRGLVAFGRRHLAARRLEIRTARENGRSVRVAERCGFRLETVLVGDHRHWDGTQLDTLVFALAGRRRPRAPRRPPAGDRDGPHREGRGP